MVTLDDPWQKNLFDQQIDLYEEQLNGGHEPRLEDYLPAEPPWREYYFREFVGLRLAVMQKRFNKSSSRDEFARFEAEFDHILNAHFPTASPIPLPAPALPSQIDHFRIDREIGRGGFGVVYQAFDTKLDRPVALKVLHTGDEYRLRDEAKTMAEMDEASGVLPVYACTKSAAKGQLYVVMKYVESRNLEQLCGGQPLSPAKAVPIFRQVCEAVKLAHRRRIIHCDIKPTNVLVEQSTGQVYLVDFGLASPTFAEPSHRGTVVVMAPEQFEGKPPSAAMDIWALGALLFYMLGGDYPFGPDPSVVERAVRNPDHEAPPVAMIRGEMVPKVLEDICARCLKKVPAERFHAVAEILTELTRWSDSRIAVNPDFPELWQRTHQSAIHAKTLQGGLKSPFGRGLTRVVRRWNEFRVATDFRETLRTELERELGGSIIVKIWVPGATPQTVKEVREFVESLPNTRVSLNCHVVTPSPLSEGQTVCALPDGSTRSSITLIHEVGPDEGYDLLAALANEARVGDPLRCGTDCVQWLIDGLDRDFNEVAVSVWKRIQDARDDRYKHIEVIASTDAPPATVTPGRPFSGRTPKVIDLNDGCFFNRPEFEALAKRAIEWIANQATDQRDQLPVFWISGPSGAGKSVALLFLIADLHRRGFGPVQLLLDAGQSLPLAVERSFRMAGRDTVPIIAVDDPVLDGDWETAGEYWKEACRLVASERGRATAGYRSPLVIACGTSEQRLLMTRKLGREAAIHEEVRVQPLQGDDVEKALAWVNLRVPPQDAEHAQRRKSLLPASDQVLFVQAMFHWLVDQTVHDFADRFRRRVSATGPLVQHWLSVILLLDAHDAKFPGPIYTAMRALDGHVPDYVVLPLSRSPLTWKSQDHYELIGFLNEDSHFGLSDADDGRKAEFKHPHLAALVYDQWQDVAPVERSRAMAEHLLNGVRVTLQHGSTPGERTSAIWRVARTRLGSAAAQARVPAEAIERMVDAFRETQYGGGAFPIWLYPSLLELSIGVRAATLTPTLVSELLAQLRSADLSATGLRRSCHSLLDHLGHFTDQLQEEVVRTIRERLERGLPRADWPHIVSALLQVRPSDELLLRCVQWFRSRETTEATPQIWLDAYQSGQATVPLLEVLRTLLQSAPHLNWFSTIEQVLKRGDGASVGSPLYDWVESNCDSVEAVFVLSLLLAENPSAWRDEAIRWLETWHQHPCANFVSERLFPDPSVSRDPRFLDYVRAWAETGCGNASYAVEHLLRHGKSGRDLQIAVTWVATNTHRSNWSYVYETLRREVGPMPEVVNVTRELLFQNRIDPAGVWVATWRAWYAMAHDHKLSTDLANQWLDTHSGHPDWPRVFGAVFDLLPPDSRVLNQATLWLQREIGRHPRWQDVWAVATTHARGQVADLRRIGQEYLARHPADAPAWSLVWRCTWIDGGTASESETAQKWLEGMLIRPDQGVTHPARAQVWKRLHQQFPTNEKIKWAGAKLLIAKWLTDPGWPVVWISYWDKRLIDEETCQKWAYEWLAGGAESPLWSAVWRRVWERDEGNPDLARHAMTYLSSPTAGPGWSEVFLAVRRRPELHATLSDLSLGWLQLHPEADKWPEVWIGQWQFAPNDSLVALGKDYLATRPIDASTRQMIWNALRGHAGAEEGKLISWFLQTIRIHEEGWPAILADLWTGYETEVRAALLSNLDGSTEDDLWPALWQAALDVMPMEEEIWTRGRSWLRQQLGRHAEWRKVWRPLLRHGRFREVLTNEALEVLRQLAPSEPGWYEVWLELVHLRPSDPELYARAVTWLTWHPDHSHWPDVWRRAWRSSADTTVLRKLATDWLTDPRQFDNKHWQVFVWKSLHAIHGDDLTLRRAGATWLKHVRRDHESWHYTWKALSDLRQRGPDDLTPQQLAELALAWLQEAPPDHRSWALQWCDLVFLAEDDDTLLARTLDVGLEWLAHTTLSAEHWSLVWKKLNASCEASPRRDSVREQLLAIAARTLEVGDFRRSQWREIWNYLAEGNQNETAIRLADLWLERVPPGHRDWDEMVRKRFTDPGERTAFALAAMRAISPESREWASACGQVFVVIGRHEELIRMAVRWLNRDLADAGNWKSVWAILQWVPAARLELIATAFRWLRGAPGDVGWQNVWEELVKLNGDEPEVWTLAQDWVTGEAQWTHPSWQYVFARVRDKMPPATANETGQGWLRWATENYPAHESWQYVWKDVWYVSRRAREDQSELIELTLAWLEKVPRHHSWFHAWESLWLLHERSRTVRLSVLAEKFLTANLPVARWAGGDSGRPRTGHSQWVKCFEAVWKVTDDEDRSRLYDLGLECLEQSRLEPPQDARELNDYRDEMVQWTFLWEALWRYRHEDPRLEAMVLNWLGTVTPATPNWSRLWCDAWQKGSLRERLRPLGMNWLADVGPLAHSSE